MLAMQQPTPQAQPPTQAIKHRDLATKIGAMSLAMREGRLRMQKMPLKRQRMLLKMPSQRLDSSPRGSWQGKLGTEKLVP